MATATTGVEPALSDWVVTTTALMENAEVRCVGVPEPGADTLLRRMNFAAEDLPDGGAWEALLEWLEDLRLELPPSGPLADSQFVTTGRHMWRAISDEHLDHNTWPHSAARHIYGIRHDVQVDSSIDETVRVLLDYPLPVFGSPQKGVISLQAALMSGQGVLSTAATLSGHPVVAVLTSTASCVLAASTWYAAPELRLRRRARAERIAAALGLEVTPEDLA